MNGIALAFAVLAIAVTLTGLYLWIFEVRHAEWDDGGNRIVWLDCHGICQRTHTPHYRHDNGHITCNGCGSPHPTSARIPRQREASHGS